MTHDISFDDFIRTTDAHHERQVQAFVKLLQERDAVYLGRFEGWYDEGQEEYYTESKAKELDYKSPISGKDMVRSSEENYYFRLSKFQKELEALHADNPEFLTPSARRNEMMGRLSEGLNDVPISRTNFKWGIQMPDDEKHVIYVWIDALMNYITAIGIGDGKDSALYTDRSKYWPASMHIMAKEISWFHSVICPLSSWRSICRCHSACTRTPFGFARDGKCQSHWVTLSTWRAWTDSRNTTAWTPCDTTTSWRDPSARKAPTLAPTASRRCTRAIS